MIRTGLFAAMSLAALAGVSAPASAQYAPYPQPYGPATSDAAQRCTAAVQHRLDRRATVSGSFEHLYGRVLAVTEVRPRGNIVRVRGTAASERVAYGPHGVGAYGALGQAYSTPGDLTWRCDVDRRGRVQRVELNRRF